MKDAIAAGANAVDLRPFFLYVIMSLAPERSKWIPSPSEAVDKSVGKENTAGEFLPPSPLREISRCARNEWLRLRSIAFSFASN